ncbi:hypothetical protein HH214_01170 [Mucilaginibacter robiniae]|uniref:Stationary phase survival protein SurE n=1 Tax=Mucilaginibacter robiniae TaxID=2728022 RepID=A0A7L5DU50_9SPHI|nr:hypothetical protein [Mucilaginibacter robiniae]QJD94582.1 hypothetical protein HH214_01170 [Mucilaginibacter robiniae]
MSVKNNLLTGLISGLIIPAIAWVIFDYKFPEFQIQHKPAVPYLIALALNLFIIRYCYKNGTEQTGKGVMLSTFVCMLLITIFKIKL